MIVMFFFKSKCHHNHSKKANFQQIIQSYICLLIMDIRIIMQCIFRPLTLFTATAIISFSVSMGVANPFIDPDQNSNNPVTSDTDGVPEQPIGKGIGISVKNVNSVIVDNDNVKWFCTDVGIVSYDGKNWKLHDGNKDLPNQDLKGVVYVVNPEGPELWIASPNGATVIRLPIDDQTDAITLNPENAGMFSK